MALDVVPSEGVLTGEFKCGFYLSSESKKHKHVKLKWLKEKQTRVILSTEDSSAMRLTVETNDHVSSGFQNTLLISNDNFCGIESGNICIPSSKGCLSRQSSSGDDCRKYMLIITKLNSSTVYYFLMALVYYSNDDTRLQDKWLHRIKSYLGFAHCWTQVDMRYPVQTCCSQKSRKTKSTVMLSRSWLLLYFYKKDSLPCYHRRFRLTELTVQAPRPCRLDGAEALVIDCADAGQYVFYSRRCAVIHENITEIMRVRGAEDTLSMAAHSYLDRQSLSTYNASFTIKNDSSYTTSSNGTAHTSSNGVHNSLHPTPPPITSTSDVAPPTPHKWLDPSYDPFVMAPPSSPVPITNIPESYIHVGNAPLYTRMDKNKPESHAPVKEPSTYVPAGIPEGAQREFPWSRQTSADVDTKDDLMPVNNCQDKSLQKSPLSKRDFLIDGEPPYSKLYDYGDIPDSPPPRPCHFHRSNSVDFLEEYIPDVGHREPVENDDPSYSYVYYGLYNKTTSRGYDLNMVGTTLCNLANEDQSLVLNQIHEFIQDINSLPARHSFNQQSMSAPLLDWPNDCCSSKTYRRLKVLSSMRKESVKKMKRYAKKKRHSEKQVEPSNVYSGPVVEHMDIGGPASKLPQGAESGVGEKDMKEKHPPASPSPSTTEVKHPLTYSQSWAGQKSEEKIRPLRRQQRSEYRPKSGYWSATGVSMLCRTLHKVLTDTPPHPDTLALPASIRAELCLKLYSDDPVCHGHRDWEALAEKIGLNSEAITIIKAFQHNHLIQSTAAEIVLRHWQFIHNWYSGEPPKCPIPCTLENLVDLLQNHLHRHDLLALFRQGSTKDTPVPPPQGPSPGAEIRGGGGAVEVSDVESNVRSEVEVKKLQSAQNKMVEPVPNVPASRIGQQMPQRGEVKGVELGELLAHRKVSTGTKTSPQEAVELVNCPQVAQVGNVNDRSARNKSKLDVDDLVGLECTRL